MGTRDLIHLGVAAVPVLALVTAAALFPVYKLMDGNVVRRPIWDPPTIPVGHGEDRMDPADFQRLMQDPRQREIIEGMQALPRTIPLRPVFMSSRGIGPRNLLGDCALLSLIAWGGLLWVKQR